MLCCASVSEYERNHAKGKLVQTQIISEKRFHIRSAIFSKFRSGWSLKTLKNLQTKGENLFQRESAHEQVLFTVMVQRQKNFPTNPSPNFLKYKTKQVVFFFYNYFSQ